MYLHTLNFFFFTLPTPISVHFSKVCNRQYSHKQGFLRYNISFGELPSQKNQYCVITLGMPDPEDTLGILSAEEKIKPKAVVFGIV